MKKNLLSGSLLTLFIGGLALSGFYGLKTNASTSATVTTVASENVAALLPATDLPAQLLPVYGGSGGTAFNRDCGTNRVLTGLRFRSGQELDAVGLLCRPVLSDGTLGPETTVGTLTGGGGGTSNAASCPQGKVVVQARIVFGSWVDSVELYCLNWDHATRSFRQGSGTILDVGRHTSPTAGQNEGCESSFQPAHAIRGRSGIFVDAFGLICDEP